MEKLRRGLAILNGSWAVLRGQPELMVLPIISTVAIISLLGAFILIDATTPALPKLEVQLKSGWFYAALFLVYLACVFVAVFCNAALIYCAQRSLEGGRASLGQGLAAAAARWPQILGWSIIVATVGLVLKMISNMMRQGNTNKLGFVALVIGIIVAALADAIWIAASYFVLPLLVVEGVGPFAAFKRSAELIRQRWGEALVGEGGLGGIAALCLLPLLGIWVWLVIAIWDAFVAGQAVNAALIPAALVLTAAIVAVSVAYATLAIIFVAGVYSYAVSGNLPGGFGVEQMDLAFKRAPPASPAKVNRPA